MGLLQRCSWPFLFSSFLLGHDICQHQVSFFSFSVLCLPAAFRFLWPWFAVCLGMRGYQCVILLMAMDRYTFWAHLVNLWSEAESWWNYQNCVCFQKPKPNQLNNLSASTPFPSCMYYRKTVVAACPRNSCWRCTFGPCFFLGSFLTPV